MRYGITAAFSAAILAAIIFAAPAAAQTTASTTIDPGGTVHVEGAGCAPHADVLVTLTASHASGQVLGNYPQAADDQGAFTLDVPDVPWAGEPTATLIAECLDTTQTTITAGVVNITYTGPPTTETGGAVIAPSSGAVGTKVRLTAPSDCKPPDDPKFGVEFMANPAAESQGLTTGATGDYQFLAAPQPDGSLDVTFRIPSTFGVWQGEGGGAVTPGKYMVGTYAQCYTTFTVTQPELARTGSDAALMTVLACGIIACGSGVLAWGTHLDARRRDRQQGEASL